MPSVYDHHGNSFWIADFLPELEALDADTTHPLSAFVRAFGPDYLAIVPERYWVHLGIRRRAPTWTRRRRTWHAAAVLPSADNLEIEQGAELGRPSRQFARAGGSAERITRVQVGGAAAIVARCEYHV